MTHSSSSMTFSPFAFALGSIFKGNKDCFVAKGVVVVDDDVDLVREDDSKLIPKLKF